MKKLLIFELGPSEFAIDEPLIKEGGLSHGLFGLIVA